MLKARLRRMRRNPRLYAMADQAVIGIGTMGGMAAFTHLIDKRDFGILGTAVGVHFLHFSLHRCSLVLPFILTAKGRDQTDNVWAWWAIGWSALSALLLPLAALASGALDLPREVGQIILYAGIFSPAMLLQEFVRRWLYQGQHNHWVVLSSACGLAMLVLSIWLLLYRGQGPSYLAPMCMAASSLTAAIVGFSRRLPWPVRLSGAFRELWWPKRWTAFWQTLAGIPQVIYNNSFVLLLAAFSGPAVAAVYSALRSLMSPSTSLIGAVDSVDKLRALKALREEGVLGAKRSVDQTRRFLLKLNLPFLLLVSVFAAPIESRLFGPGYVNVPATWLMALTYLLQTCVQPFESFLIVRERSRVFFTSRLISAATVIVGVWLLGRSYGLSGALVALAFAQSLNVAMLWYNCRQQVREALAEERTAERGRPPAPLPDAAIGPSPGPAIGPTGAATDAGTSAVPSAAAGAASGAPACRAGAAVGGSTLPEDAPLSIDAESAPPRA